MSVLTLFCYFCVKSVETLELLATKHVQTVQLSRSLVSQLIYDAQADYAGWLRAQFKQPITFAQNSGT